MKNVEIWTDGSCWPNPGPGGWGAVLFYGKHKLEISGSEKESTNNRMELMAAIQALDNDAFGNVIVEVSNPNSYRIDTDIRIEPPGRDTETLKITKNGINWIAQKLNPAYLRV